MEISYLLLIKMEQLKFIIFKKKQVLMKKTMLNKKLKLMLILMLFYSIANSLKFMLLEQAKDYKLEKLKKVLNQSLKIKMKLVFLLLMIKANHIYLLDLPMEPLEFTKLQITEKIKINKYY